MKKMKKMQAKIKWCSPTEVDTVSYRVYTKDGVYHHSYVSKEDAVSCAKHISGRVQDVKKDRCNLEK